MLMPCVSSSLYCIQTGIFINTHGPVVSLSSLSLPPPYSPRVAAEVGRRLDTISIHLCSLPPLASRKSGSFPRLHSAFMHALTSSPGNGSQHGPLAAAHSEQFVYGQCLNGIRKPRSVGGLTDRAARESCCPPLRITQARCSPPLGQQSHCCALQCCWSYMPGLILAYATKALHSESPEVLVQPCRDLNCAPNV